LATIERLLWIDTIFLLCPGSASERGKQEAAATCSTVQAGAVNGVSSVRPSLFSTGMVAFVLMIGSTAAEALDDAAKSRSCAAGQDHPKVARRYAWGILVIVLSRLGLASWAISSQELLEELSELDDIEYLIKAAALARNE